MLQIGILSLTAALNIILGLIVYLKNPKATTNRFFLMLTSTFVVWSVVNHLSVNPVLLSQLVWIRLVLFCGALLNLAVFLTFLAFPAQNLPPHYRRRARIAVYSTVPVMLLTLTPLVFKSLKIVNGSAQPQPNPGIGLFLLQTVALLGASFVILIKKYRSSHGRTKNQFRIVLLGIAGTFTTIVITNFLLVVFFHFTALVPFGPSFTLIFTGTFAYAIIRHKLFDIRLIVARSLGYLLSIGFLAALYGVSTNGLADILSHFTHVQVLVQVINIGLLTIAVLTYSSVKHFFERVTNRIFYRDAYDPEVFLDQLNKILVASVELHVLTRQVSSLIEDNIKAQYGFFVLKGVDKEVMSTKLRISNDDIETLDETSTDFAAKVIVTDELDSHHRLKNLLDRHDAGALIRLVDTASSQETGIGYLLLGVKKSGNPYNKQDVKTLEIIANELVIAIQNALRFEEIQEFAATLQEKVNEATHRLQQTNVKLKALDATKDEFISMASHQLRTPLTSVKGYLSMVLDGDAGKLNDMQHKLLDQAFVSSQRMVYLIADLLNVSRLRTGKFIIEPVESNLADVVEGEVSQLYDTAKNHKLTLAFKKPEHFPTLMLDETKIRQVVMNFTDNAIYYTPAGGHITLHLVDKPESVEFTVTDDGIGVPKAEQHHLFSKFYRAGNAQKARPDGTGLGLFMAQKVVIAQGGSIIFKSQEGKGSTFGFAFAKAKLLPPEKTAPESVE